MTVQLLVLVAICRSALSAHVLFVSPLPSPSHHMWNMVLIDGLLRRGHHVTMLTHETEENPPKNLTVITVAGFYDVFYKHFDSNTFGDSGIIASTIYLHGFADLYCAFDATAPEFRKLLDYPKNAFDLLIFDGSLPNRCYYPLIEIFGHPPALVVTPFLLPPLVLAIFGGHVYSSYQPFYSTDYTSRMSFTQRLLNFVYISFESVYKNYVALPREDALIKERFPGLKASPAELERGIGLLLCNMDPVLDYPIALPPNIIPVGGLHARPAKPLPKDLQKIMDEAKDGVVLFSLGTNVRSAELGEDVKRNLLQAFGKLPQVVLWKFEADELADVPKNVIIRKWLPQNDILGHPNIRLFVNHGGALSLQEAMYHGVPVVGIPFYTDQFSNVRRMEEKGVSKTLDRTELTLDNVYGALHEVLTSPEYKKNMKDVSQRYRAQPQSALDRAVFWIEYLLKHGTVEHLVLPARDMPLYQTTNLDVLAVFALGFVALYYVLKCILGCIKSLFTPKRGAKQKTS